MEAPVEGPFSAAAQRHTDRKGPLDWLAGCTQVKSEADSKLRRQIAHPLAAKLEPPA